MSFWTNSVETKQYIINNILTLLSNNRHFEEKLWKTTEKQKVIETYTEMKRVCNTFSLHEKCLNRKL